jgi:voltage-gated potassium channel
MPANTRRYRALRRFQAALEVPMIVLAFAWLAIFVAEAVSGEARWMASASWLIWACFLVEYGVGLLLAGNKATYVRRNWLKAVALLAPALRILRVVRLVRVARVAGLARGARMVRIITSLNRGMKALGRTFGRRGAPYVLLLTVVVTLVGAAGMFAFENEGPGSGGFRDYADALWWTAMVMTTMGSAYWPQTGAGRVLCLLLSLYAFAVFGYLTALLASFFVGRDATGRKGDPELARVAAELSELRTELTRTRSGDAG